MGRDTGIVQKSDMDGLYEVEDVEEEEEEQERPSTSSSIDTAKEDEVEPYAPSTMDAEAEAKETEKGGGKSAEKESEEITPEIDDERESIGRMLLTALYDDLVFYLRRATGNRSFVPVQISPSQMYALFERGGGVIKFALRRDGEKVHMFEVDMSEFVKKHRGFYDLYRKQYREKKRREQIERIREIIALQKKHIEVLLAREKLIDLVRRKIEALKRQAQVIDSASKDVEKVAEAMTRENEIARLEREKDEAVMMIQRLEARKKKVEKERREVKKRLSILEKAKEVVERVKEKIANVVEGVVEGVKNFFRGMRR
ncbi:MAG: hypothetical protein ACPLX7_10060 [Candidatus Kapaibacteriota bacterium]